MTTYYIESDLTVTNFGTAEELEEFLDLVLEHLYEMDDPIDPDYGASLTEGKVEVTFSVEAVDEPRALKCAIVALRTAVHAAEGTTVGWEAEIKRIQTLIRETDLATV